MLFSCFYNLITTSIPYRKGFFFFFCGGLSDKGQGCHQTSLAAVRQSLFTFSVIALLCHTKRKCKRSPQKPPGHFLCSSLYPIYSLLLFHPLWVVKCSLIFRWSTQGPIDFFAHQDSGVATRRLLLTLADDNLTKHGTDEKAYELGWAFPLLSHHVRH